MTEDAKKGQDFDEISCPFYAQQFSTKTHLREQEKELEN